MGELSKRIYFGGRYAKRRWENYKKLAQQYFDNSVSALIRHAISKTYNLDPETGDPLNKDTESPPKHGKPKQPPHTEV
jgi:D-alanyl-D-alanine carboxypeptidase